MTGLSELQHGLHMNPRTTQSATRIAPISILSNEATVIPPPITLPAEREPSLPEATDSRGRSGFREPSWQHPAQVVREPPQKKLDNDDIAERKSRRDIFKDANTKRQDIREPADPGGVRDPIQDEANRVFREKRLEYKAISERQAIWGASPEPSVVGKWNKEIEEPVVRIVTPPEMKRAPKRANTTARTPMCVSTMLFSPEICIGTSRPLPFSPVDPHSGPSSIPEIHLPSVRGRC